MNKEEKIPTRPTTTPPQLPTYGSVPNPSPPKPKLRDWFTTPQLTLLSKAAALSRTDKFNLQRSGASGMHPGPFCGGSLSKWLVLLRHVILGGTFMEANLIGPYYSQVLEVVGAFDGLRAWCHHCSGQTKVCSFEVSTFQRGQQEPIGDPGEPPYNAK